MYIYVYTYTYIYIKPIGCNSAVIVAEMLQHQHINIEHPDGLKLNQRHFLTLTKRHHFHLVTCTLYFMFICI